MPEFSKRSRENLSSCHPDLQQLFNTVVKYYDCSIICGFRGKAAQAEAFQKGFSKARYPFSAHNTHLSTAVDVAPFIIDWEDIERFRHFAGFVKLAARVLKIDVGWGGDFTVNGKPWFDGAHWELIITDKE